MASATEWCYYDFSTGLNNGWYRKGTFAGQPVKCVTQAAKPGYAPAPATTGTTTPPGPHIHVSTGAGAGMFAAVVAACYAAAIIKHQKGRYR